MIEISKTFKTIKQAEKFQNSLYNRFNYVALTSSPIWSEEGVYTWDVQN
jgi:hypothetical protein